MRKFANHYILILGKLPILFFKNNQKLVYLIFSLMPFWPSRMLGIIFCLLVRSCLGLGNFIALSLTCLSYMFSNVLLY